MKIMKLAGWLIILMGMTACPFEPTPLRPLPNPKVAAPKAIPPFYYVSPCRIKSDFNRKYFYDSRGRLSKVIDIRRGGEYDLYYDKNDYLISTSLNGVHSESFMYDGNGNLSRIIQAGSTRYFENGKYIKQIIQSAGQVYTVTFTTDSRGYVVQQVNDYTTNRYHHFYKYDDRGNLLEEGTLDRPDYPTKVRYDTNPNPVFEVTRFKGFPRGMLDYPAGIKYISPNNGLFTESTYWSFSNTPVTTSGPEYEYQYNSYGYPLTFRVVGTTEYRTVSSEYEGCP
jgi:YD repeat-containing protein